MEERESNKHLEEKKAFSIRLKQYIKNIINFSQYDIKTIIYIILFLILVAISLFLIYYILFIDETILYKLVVSYFVNPIYELQVIGIFLFILIMAFQGLIVPIPSEVVLLATGMIWGIFLGGFMGIVGSMAAGTLCFYISKKGGRPLAEKFVGEKAINIADTFIHKHGTKAIIIARFIPFIPFDVISYTSGLVDIDIKKYLIGTLIGSIFRSFFYAFLGALFFLKYDLSLPIDFGDLPLNDIQEQSIYFNIILLIILVVLVLMIILYYFLIKYLEKKR
ncbi:MAG: TVP38/TMEM64 family protein [Promethearchaeota archaeon]